MLYQMKDNIILLFIILFLIIIVISYKKKIEKKEKITIKKNNNKKSNNIIYEELIRGGITNINYHCKITQDNIFIFNEHQPLINKKIDNQYYKDILLFISNIDLKDLIAIQSKEDHIGDYEILNNIIKINGVDIDYKKLCFNATFDERYNKYKLAIDKIREYKSITQKF
jgi:hypothetical protein